MAAFITTGKLAGGTFKVDPRKYSDNVIKAAVIAAIFWGCVGMLVGLTLACQLAWPNIFYFPQWGFLNFGRIRPLHTSAVIFAFGGNVLIATSFDIVQRTCKARLPACDRALVRILGLSAVHRDGRHRLCDRRHPIGRNTPNRNGTPICG